MITLSWAEVIIFLVGFFSLFFALLASMLRNYRLQHGIRHWYPPSPLLP